MFWKNILATKSLEMLDAEAKGENRLRRVLGPIGLTSLGVGAIIGAGIFVMTGRVAAFDAGPGILVSFLVAGFACTLAAFCYAEFASLAPVAGSAYTYAYATLGEIFAWIIGWDLILEYAMSAATVAASWSEYLNKLLIVLKLPKVPDFLCSDPFSTTGAWFNLPAVLVLLACTVVLVIGIRESAMSNLIMVLVKLGVVIFVICVGLAYVNGANWTSIPPEARNLPEQRIIPTYAAEHASYELDMMTKIQNWAESFHDKAKIEEISAKIDGKQLVFQAILPPKDKEKKYLEERSELLTYLAMMQFFEDQAKVIVAKGLDRDMVSKREKAFERNLGRREDGEVLKTIKKQLEKRSERDIKQDQQAVAAILKTVESKREVESQKPWGMWAYFGVTKFLQSLDEATRSSFMPYGLSGVMLGASIVFFAFIGFDSISTHAEEAIKPARDVPFGIIASLVLCSALYIAVSAVLTGMVPYQDIDPKAAMASGFSDLGLNAAAALIALGGLAGMTSVLLITFLSQARIFLAMARDGLLPHGVFGAVHHKFRTPHISTMLTGALMCLVAAFTPITKLEEMVNIGTLFAFVVVCASVLMLRIKRPEAPRPFRCPLVFIVAPLGVLANIVLMLFLPIDTWERLVYWLLLGLVLYFSFGYRFSVMRQAGTPQPHESRPDTSVMAGEAK